MKLRLLLAILCALCGHARAAEKLNVLIIMADDLRDFGGAFTRGVVKTPNLDRLRARGTTFERAYVQYPVCNPSRSSMMTGLRAEQTGIVGNDTRLREIMPDVVTLPQLFKDAGWQSHAFGKLFHLGGGRNEQARQQWMDTGRSWHTAQAFEATKTGKGPKAKGPKWMDGLPVDASGVTPDGKAFADINGLRKLLADQPEKLAWGVTWHLATYATGAPSGPLDRKAIQQIVDFAKQSDYGLRSLVHGVVQSDLFRTK